MHLTKKSFRFFLVFMLVFSLNTPFVLAFDLSSLTSLLGDTSSGENAFGQASVLALGPSVSSQVSGILTSLGLEKSEVKKTAKTFNASSYKNDGPQVVLTFVPATPAPGKKITAVASPSYFANNPNSMYFTWFLKKASCEGNNDCDYNKDGQTDIEDYKIEAARIMATGNFEWQKIIGIDDPNCNSVNPPEHCNLPNQDDGPAGNNNDSDEYKAVIGGMDQKGKPNHCFIHNVKSGIDIEVGCGHLFPKTSPAVNEAVGDGFFGAKEEAFWHTDPNANDTSQTGSMDEATVAGLGKMQFSWIYSPGDQIGVAVEGVSVNPTTAKDSSYKTMWAITNNPDVVAIKKKEDGTDDEDPLEGIDGRLYYRFKSKGDGYCGGAGGECSVRISCSTGDTEKTFENPGIPADGGATEQGSPYRYEETGKPKFLWKSVGGSCHCLAIIIDKSYPDDCEVCTDNNAGAEECHEPSGRLGMEGENDFGDLAADKPTIEDLNAALEFGFVEPTTGTDYKKISNNLSSSHSSPQYDASSGGGNSDSVTLRSNTTNSDDKNFTNYKWELDVADSADATNWKSLTQTDLGGAVPLEGMGLDELKVPLSSIKKEALTAAGVAEDATTFYVRATLKTKENAAGGVKKEGLETMIIPVQSSKGEMGAASAITDGGVLQLGNGRCTMGAEKSVCPVTPNEIVAVNIPTSQYNPAKYSFSWTLDGARLAPEEGTPNLAFFPVTEGAGKVYTVKVDIAGLDSEEKVSFVRSFKVAEPETTMKSLTSSDLAPVLLGSYVDRNQGQQWADYSQDLFQAVEGKTVQLQAQNNTSLAGKTVWYVDGGKIDSQTASSTVPYLSATGRTLNLPIVKDIGSSYKVISSTSYAKDADREKILYTKWGIPSASLASPDITKTITIKVADNLNGEKKVTAAPQPKILASLFSGLPGYIAFLFKIIVTFALILLASGLVFRLSPEKIREQ